MQARKFLHLTAEQLALNPRKPWEGVLLFLLVYLTLIGLSTGANQAIADFESMLAHVASQQQLEMLLNGAPRVKRQF